VTCPIVVWWNSAWQAEAASIAATTVRLAVGCPDRAGQYKLRPARDIYDPDELLQRLVTHRGCGRRWPNGMHAATPTR
jgi:hypothetical protein